MALAGVVLLAAVVWWRHRPVPTAREAAYEPLPAGTLTFNKHIAPIVYKNCAPCHRPGQAAPFALLDFASVQKRAPEILKVIQKRAMPPWLPDSDAHHFVGERRLSATEIGMIQQWAAEGAKEGMAADLPPQPVWAQGWQLGEPDLVIQAPKAFTLPAAGKDVYRNFVIPVPLASNRFVRAAEIRPGNSRVVHHAFLYVDRTRQSRRLAEQETEPGFPGMKTPESARMPEGQFVTWQPGKLLTTGGAPLTWVLQKGADIVLQMHMNPSGKPEPVQPSVGFYFTDTPPSNTPFKICLTSLAIDIFPDERDHVVADEFVLPVDAEVIGVLPHAHYLAREMSGAAVLPDGRKESLIHIAQWDFNWQGDYRYEPPVLLPKGTKLEMRFTFDNSTNNTRNPHTPPARVRYGPQSADEMAELWFQILLRNPGDLPALQQAYAAKSKSVFRDYATHLLATHTKESKAHIIMGQFASEDGRPADAEKEFRAAIAVAPDSDEAHYDLGIVLQQQKRLGEARSEFETAIRLNPRDGKYFGSLGLVFLELGDLPQAESNLEKAVQLDPYDVLGHDYLNAIRKELSSPTTRRNP